MNNNLPYAAQASTIPPYNGTSSLHPQSLKSLEQSENPRSRNDMRRESTALCWRRCGTRYVLGQSGISTFLRSEGTSLRSYAAAFAASAAAAFISIHAAHCSIIHLQINQPLSVRGFFDYHPPGIISPTTIMTMMTTLTSTMTIMVC
jgi:hypothetical protein